MSEEEFQTSLQIMVCDGKILFVLMNAEIVELQNGTLAPIIRFPIQDAFNLGIHLTELAVQNGASVRNEDDEDGTPPPNPPPNVPFKK